MTACVFRLCAANVTMVPERSAPGPSPDATVRIPQHPLGGLEEFGLCPASLLLYPLSDYDAAQLEEQALAIERIIHDRDNQREDRGPSGVQPQHGPKPKPDPDPYWFRHRGLGSKPAGLRGYVAPPVMPQVLLPPTSPARQPTEFIGPATPTGGTTGVSQVEETRAAISAAQEVCKQVSQALLGLESEAGTALETLNTIRETSIDPMGAPQISAAIEKMGEASALLREAVEIGDTYKGTL